MGASASFLDAEESYEPIRVGQRKRVVVFDFDKTLAAVDVNLYSQQGVAALGGHDRVKSLDSMLAAIRSFGCDLGIVSFNSRSTVVKTLNAARLLRHFRARDCYGIEQHPKGDLDKAKLTFAKIMKPRGIRPQDVCFVDDNGDNLRDLRANRNTKGCELHHIRTGMGMDDEDMERVVRWAEGKKPPRRRKTDRLATRASWKAPLEIVSD